MPRVSVRADGTGGFLFFNNYVRQWRMPERTGFQVKVKLANETVLVPEEPITLPSGAYGIWPINMKLGDATLRYATAQPLAHLTKSGGSTFYFVENSDVPPEFVFETPINIIPKLDTRVKIVKSSTRVVVRDLLTSMEPAFSLRSSNGALTDVVLLSRHQGENAWKIAANGNKGLLLTSSDFYADDSSVVLQAVGIPNFEFQIAPSDLFAIRGNAIATRVAGSILNCAATQTAHYPKLSIRKVADAGLVPPVKLGPKLPWRDAGVAMAPEDSKFDLAAKWDLTLSPDAWQVDNLFLTIHYVGDVARLTSGGKLLVDNFYDGTPWTVGLNRFRRQIAEHGLQLQILPRRRDAPVYIESGDVSAEKEHDGQILNLGGIDLLPEYELKFDLLPDR